MASIQREAERCLKCKIPMCSKNCPVATPIPEVMNQFLKGDIREAGRILFNNNPLSAITSVVCPHESNCYGHCVLGKKGEPIEFYKIEQYISSYYLDTVDFPPFYPNGKKVAIIGSGPAGITMAIKLALAGYQITVFEKDKNIGGVLRYGIPNFRLSNDILDTYKRKMETLGIKFRLNVSVGTDLEIDDLFMDGYKAVYVAIGAGRPNKLGLLGETLGHVNYAINYLRSPKTFSLGRRVVVIGAGNVAMDAARTAIRIGHAEVTLINNHDENHMTATPQEIEMAILDGVKILSNLQTVRITDQKVYCVKNSETYDEQGNRHVEEDFSSSVEIPADSVILAIGQGPRSETYFGDNMDLNKRGLITVDEFGETTKKNVFSGGDVVTGPSTVVESVATTLRAADTILKRLETL